MQKLRNWRTVTGYPWFLLLLCFDVWHRNVILFASASTVTNADAAEVGNGGSNSHLRGGSGSGVGMTLMDATKNDVALQQDDRDVDGGGVIGGGSVVPEASLIVPLEAASGTHYVTIYVGQPPQPQTLIVDTGSSLTAWQCDCPDCKGGGSGGQDLVDRQDGGTSKTTKSRRYLKLDRYSPSKSTTQQPRKCGECELSDNANEKCKHNMNPDVHGEQQCPLTQRYTEGSSWTAYEINELVTFQPILAAEIQSEDDNDSVRISNTHSNKNAVASAGAGVNDIFTEDAIEWTMSFTFGCQTSVTGLFRKQHDNGIMGMERTDHSIVSQMFHQQLIERNAFSLCIGVGSNDHNDVVNNKNPRSTSTGSSTANSRNTSRSGYMGFGGALTTKHLEPMRFTPLVLKDKTTAASAEMYVVNVQQVWLGGTCVVCPSEKDNDDNNNDDDTDSKLLQSFRSGKGTILDSGTTDTFLPEAIAHVFYRAWKKETHGLHFIRERTRQYTYEEFIRLPTLYFVFQGDDSIDNDDDDTNKDNNKVKNTNNVTLEVPPLHYMENAGTDPDPTTWPRSGKELTNRLYVDEPVGAVLGLNVLRGYDIYYDNTNDRIGFARANCT